MNPSRSKRKHPPLCPRTSKASTLSIPTPQLSQLSQHNKNQRLTHRAPSYCSSRQQSPQSRPPRPQPRPTAPVSNNGSDKDIRLGEYQQYSRKNYLRRGTGERKLQSDLTDRQAKRHQSSQNSLRHKSKSALDYAKYFIKQVSNLPTEPSSREQNNTPPDQTTVTHEEPQKQKENSDAKRQLASEREHSRNKNRNNIVQKLKSLRTIRTKSNRHGSVERELVPSIQKRSSNKRNSAKKIEGNIDNLLENETLLTRMKARSRNRRIVFRVRQLNISNNPLQQSINLMLDSLMERSHSDRALTVQKIQLHLQMLNLLPSYVKQFKQIYEEVQCWDELLFLTYKKFYFQRLKIVQALEATNPTISPFRLPFASVSAIELRLFNSTIQGLRLQQKVKKQNILIEGALRELYNHIIQKSGKYINLLEHDNFTEELYWLMGEEVRLLGQSEDVDLSQVRATRIAMTIKCCYLIAHLNGEEIDIQTALSGSQFESDQVPKFQAFLSSIAE